MRLTCASERFGRAGAPGAGATAVNVELEATSNDLGLVEQWRNFGRIDGLVGPELLSSKPPRSIN